MNEASELMTSEMTRRDAVRSDLEGIVELSPGGHYAIRIEPGGDSKLLYASRKVQEIIGLDMEEFKHDARKCLLTSIRMIYPNLMPDDPMPSANAKVGAWNSGLRRTVVPTPGLN